MMKTCTQLTKIIHFSMLIFDNELCKLQFISYVLKQGSLQVTPLVLKHLALFFF